MTEKYIDLETEYKRLHGDLTILYQLQNINNTTVKAVNIGPYAEDPLIKIMTFNMKNIICDVIAFTATEDEIKTGSSNIIGILFSKNDHLVGSLMIRFIITDPARDKTRLIGYYKIVYEEISDREKICHNIENLTEYPGNDELINKLLSYISHEKLRNLFK